MCNCAKGLGAINTPNFAQYLDQNKTSFDFSSPEVKVHSDDVDGKSLVYAIVGGVAVLAIGVMVWKIAKET